MEFTAKYVDLKLMSVRVVDSVAVTYITSEITKVRQGKLRIRSVSEKAILSHEALYFEFYNKMWKYSVLVMRQGVVFQFIW